MASDVAALVARARAGDEHAFADLVAPLRAELVVHSYRMLGSVAEAEDSVQESLARAWRGLAAYDERGTFRAWLYRIVTNRCLTALGRRRELSTEVGQSDTGDEVRWLEPMPDSLMAYASALEPEARTLAWESVELAFIAAIQQLPARQRAVLLLREVLAFSAEETAGLLDMTVPAVNSALQRARRQREARVPDRVAATGDERESARRYAIAWEAGDVDTIVEMLAADARYSMPPLLQVFTGRAAIRDFLVTGPLQEHDMRWRFLPARVNGQVAFGTYLWNGDVGAYLPGGLDVVTFNGAGRIREVVAFLEADFAAFDLPDRLADDGEKFAPAR